MRKCCIDNFKQYQTFQIDNKEYQKTRIDRIKFLESIGLNPQIFSSFIPEIMIKNGATPVTRVLNNEEYLQELNKKLFEEVNEYLESGSLEEIVDIEEVILAILKTKNISIDELEKIRVDKSSKRGSFDKKIFLEKEL